MSHQDYQRGYLDGQMNHSGVRNGAPVTDADVDFVFATFGLISAFGKKFWQEILWAAAFLSVAWFWGFYPMVAAIVGVIAIRSVSAWRERLWAGKGRWVILAALALLPILGHTALGIPAAASLSQHQGPAVHGQKVVKGEK